MAVLKSPRNNKNKGYWARQYFQNERMHRYPTVLSLLPKYNHDAHRKLSIKRSRFYLYQNSETSFQSDTVDLPRTELTLTTFETLLPLPHHRHFRNERNRRRIFYPLIFNSII